MEPREQSDKQAKEQQNSSYQLTLMTANEMHTLRLPTAMDGEIPLIVKGEQLLSVNAREGAWYVSGLQGVLLNTTNDRRSEVKIHDDGYWYLIAEGNRQILFAEANTPSNISYQHYSVTTPARITIGRGLDNDIQFKNPYVSKRHATLTFEKDHFRIEDARSANGVFVNGVRIHAADLSLGDVVSILGMRIIIGSGFIAINSNKHAVDIVGHKLERFVHPSPASARNQLASLRDEGAKEFFNRLPRRRLPLRNQDITIEMPPFKISDNGIPLMLRMGGSMAAGATTLMMGNPLMLLSTVLFPVLTAKYTERQREEYEVRRVYAYTNYLIAKRQEIANAKRIEERVLRSNYPEMNVILGYPVSGDRLWERRNTDDDFLSLRLGAGSLPMTTKINYPEERFTLENDDLENKMYAVAKERVRLDNVPIMLNLLEHRLCGVIGPKQTSMEFVRQAIMRIAMLYSYDEVKLVLLARPEDMESLKFARYLPHVWNDQRTMRFVATTPNDAYLIGEYLAKELEEEIRSPRPLDRILKDRPYYLVIALDKSLQDCMEILKTCSQIERNCGLGLISVFDDIPKDCTAQITLSKRGLHSLSNLNDIEQEDEHFRLDKVNERTAARGVFDVSNKVLKAVDTTYSLPQSLSFLEMYGAGKVSHLNILKRWEESDPVSSLAAPIGVDTTGGLFNLDLHQKYQGPHGLVAGMTGSGKSEFLLTYILSMAINYQPDEVSFLLIDYKGGGLAGAFEDKQHGLRLPHLAGTITNLDGSAIQRSLISLQSETLRRQRVFNEAKTISGESTMDIYTYQRLYRQGVIKEPISHLFIISDEFAELHDQQREFLDQLISIARIGRSLGIHLILATQKPGGLVNDQILSNTKFRVCLKVQTKSDSNDMLKRPEAAELQETGRFYLQVGYNELFALGQSAWSGASYVPHDGAMKRADRTISLIDDVGQEVVQVKPHEVIGKSEGSQLSAIVHSLAHLASKKGLEARQLWTPPLPKDLDITELEEPNTQKKASLSLQAPVGIVDDPERQQQYPLALDFIKSNNMLVVGAARSGKTTFVNTVLLQLLSSYTPEEFNFYILDYSSRMLNMFSPFPHCGGVVTEADGESLNAFFDLIDGIVDERKELFEELGVDSYEAARALQDLPLILVIIDNFAGMRSTKKGEEFAYAIDAHLKRGVQYGIKYLITCSHPNEVSMRARQELETRFALQAKDKYEYDDILGVRINYLPPEDPGRGLCIREGRPLEMQIATIGAHLKPRGRIEALKSRVEDLLKTASSATSTAKRLPSVDEALDYDDFCKLFDPGVLPLGYHLDGAKPIALPMRQFTGLSAYFGNEESVRPVLSNFIHFAQREKMKTLLVKRTARTFLDDLVKTQLSDEEREDILTFETSDESVQSLIQTVLGELQARQKIWNTYRASDDYEAGAVDAFDYMRQVTRPWFVLFESFENLCYLSNEVNDIMVKLLPLFHEFNLYALGCFYPDDRFGVSNKALFKAFNQDDVAILFGGRYSEQKCTELPRDFARITAEGSYNRFLMKYRNKCYSLLMPCEELTPVVTNKDELSIFA